LTFSKLGEDAYNTTAMSVCCGILIVKIHPAYEGNSVPVVADSCKIYTQDEDEDEALKR